jgi:hypothetical protein
MHASQPKLRIKVKLLDLCVGCVSVGMHSFQGSPFLAILERRPIYLTDLDVRRLQVEGKVEIVPKRIADKIDEIMGIPFRFRSVWVECSAGIFSNVQRIWRTNFGDFSAIRRPWSVVRPKFFNRDFLGFGVDYNLNIMRPRMSFDGQRRPWELKLYIERLNRIPVFPATMSVKYAL